MCVETKKLVHPKSTYFVYKVCGSASDPPMQYYICKCIYFTATGIPMVVGFENERATVLEGATVECCVLILSGVAEFRHILHISSVPVTASGLSCLIFPSLAMSLA